jgi:hypothetical protein
MSTTIAGVWELVDEHYEGLLVATETHASAILMRKGRQLFSGPEPTEAEEAEAYRTLVAQAGPYTIEGSILTHHRRYARYPNSVGTDEQLWFQINGDRMTMHSIRPNGTSGPEMHWRKVG